MIRNSTFILTVFITNFLILGREFMSMLERWSNEFVDVLILDFVRLNRVPRKVIIPCFIFCPILFMSGLRGTLFPNHYEVESKNVLFSDWTFRWRFRWAYFQPAQTWHLTHLQATCSVRRSHFIPYPRSYRM